jgi:hypothetical protein
MIEHILTHLKDKLDQATIVEMMSQRLLEKIIENLKVDEARENHEMLLSSTVSLLSLFLLALPPENRQIFEGTTISEQILSLIKKTKRTTTNTEFFRKCIFCLARLKLSWEQAIVVLEHWNDSDQKLSTEVSWVLASVSQTASFHEKIIQHPNLLSQAMVKLRNSSDTESLMPLLRMVGNLTSAEVWKIQILLDLGILEVLDRLMRSENSHLVIGAFWGFRNLCAGTKSQVLACVKSGAFERSLALVMTEDDGELWGESAWTALNAIQSALEHEVYEIAAEPNVAQCLIAIMLSNISDLLKDTAFASALYLCDWYKHSWMASHLDATNVFAELFRAKCFNVIQTATQSSYHARKLIKEHFGPDIHTFD